MITDRQEIINTNQNLKQIIIICLLGHFYNKLIWRKAFNTITFCFQILNEFLPKEYSFSQHTLCKCEHFDRIFLNFIHIFNCSVVMFLAFIHISKKLITFFISNRLAVKKLMTFCHIQPLGCEKKF